MLLIPLSVDVHVLLQKYYRVGLRGSALDLAEDVLLYKIYAPY